MSMADRTDATVITYGKHGDVRADDLVLHDDLTSAFVLATPAGSRRVELAARGRHNVDNALAAASVGVALGVPLDAMATAFAEAAVSAWRMELQRASSGAVILNDAYNANPVSMRAALEALAALPAARRTAVLGTMAELGPDSGDEHRSIADVAAQLGIRVLAVGTKAYGAEQVDDIDDAVAALEPLGPDDAVLVKGSRVAGLERLAARLIAAGR
jgi:UDP-N-acetylmuramoyl-tripeptide--D-alanyl-D-alanine ligase